MNFQSTNKLHSDTIEIHEFRQAITAIGVKGTPGCVMACMHYQPRKRCPSQPIIELYNIGHTKGRTWSDSVWKAVEGESVGMPIFKYFFRRQKYD